MKKRNVPLLGLVFLGSMLGAGQRLIAQKMEYRYDANGNRILKKELFANQEEDDPNVGAFRKRLDEIKSPVPEAALVVYPNPTTNRLYVEWNDGYQENITYRLINLSGQISKMGRCLSSFNEIDFSAILPGNYLLELRYSGQVKRIPIVKQ